MVFPMVSISGTSSALGGPGLIDAGRGRETVALGAAVPRKLWQPWEVRRGRSCRLGHGFISYVSHHQRVYLLDYPSIIHY